MPISDEAINALISKLLATQRVVSFLLTSYVKERGNAEAALREVAEELDRQIDAISDEKFIKHNEHVRLEVDKFIEFARVMSGGDRGGNG